MKVPDDVIDFFPSGPDDVRPFVYEDGSTVSLHFTIGEVQSRMRRDDPTALDLDYTRMMMGLLLWQPRPKSMLMVGLGGGSLPKYCFRHLPETDLTVVEINPHVIALRDAFHVPPDGPRFRVLQADGAAFVRAASARYDIVVIDGFGYDGQPEELCSPGFYDDCRRALTPGGVLVVNLHAEREDCEALVSRIGDCMGAAPLAVHAADGGNRIVFSAGPAEMARCAAGHRQRWKSLAATHRHTLRDSHARLAAALDAYQRTRMPG